MRTNLLLNAYRLSYGIIDGPWQIPSLSVVIPDSLEPIYRACIDIYVTLGQEIGTLDFVFFFYFTYLGLTVETVSWSLTQLRQDGLIEFLSPRQLRLVDIAALQALNS